MKKISIMVPCYNEEENVEPLSEALIAMFAKDLPQYDYEILFIDNEIITGYLGDIYKKGTKRSM